MTNKNTLVRKLLAVVGVVALGLLLYYFGSNNYLFTSLVSKNAATVSGDVYIPDDYEASPAEQGEIDVLIGKSFSKVAGIQLTVSYPANQLNIYDAVVTGLPTSSFLVIKNTNTPGVFQLSMAQATGVNLAVNDSVVSLKVEIKSTVAEGTEIPLNLSNVAIVDENGATLPASVGNGKITVGGTVVPPGEAYIQSITPDYGLSGSATSVLIQGQRLPGNVTSVKVGTTSLTNVVASNGQITGTVPSGLTTGVYDVTITDATGQVISKEKAFTIIDQADGLTIDQQASYFTPNKVKNDNAMTTTLWVKADDLHGVEDIDYVDVNLGSIGGNASTRLTADKIVDKSEWFYLSGIKVPTTTPTSLTPYGVTVTATNKIGKVAKATIYVTVVGDVETNIKPVVRQAYTVPLSVSNKGKTPFTIYAYVTDDDGSDKLDNVVVDLSVIGSGIKTMTKEGNAVGNGFWYKVEGVEVSTQANEGNFSGIITASNKSGDTGTGTVNIHITNSVNLPQILSDTYISPDRVPNDNTTPFAIYALVKDPDGVDDIDKVVASFSDTGIAPQEMTKGANQGDRGWFELKDLKMPTTTLRGTHKITITATDKAGNSVKTDLNLGIVDPNQVINHPLVDSTKSYTTPNAVANDGTTGVNLYAFVTDPDGNEDIQSVNVDLRQIGLKPANQMTADQPEGKGKWFKFTTKVPPIIAPSSQPYELTVTATDKSDAVGQGKIYLRIVDTNVNQIAAPQIETAVPIAQDKIEIIFDSNLDSTSVSYGGDNFSIFDRNDIRTHLTVRSATLNTRGNIVIIQTDQQVQDKAYTLVVDTRVKDLQGNSVRTNYGDKVDFRGYKEDKKAPSVKLLSSTSPTTVEIEFWSPLKPSSVSLQGDDFHIFEVASSSHDLKVLSVKFKDSNTLLLTTEKQKYALAYGMTISNLQNISGVALPKVGIEAYFKGYISALVGDLNFDGKVDFNDFTIFADAYRQGRGYTSNGTTTNPLQPDTSISSGYLNLVGNDSNSNSNNTNSSATTNANVNS